MRFGGTTQFGCGVYGGEPFAISPQYIVDRIVASLSRFLKVRSLGSQYGGRYQFGASSFGGVRTVGFLQTLGRFTGPMRSAPMIEHVLDLVTKAGNPAMLVGFEGGEFQPHNVGGAVHRELVTFNVICVASQFETRTIRLTGRRPIVQPGLDDMTNMAITYTGRELLTMTKALFQPRPVSRRNFMTANAMRFVSVVTWQGTLCHDFFDDEPSAEIRLKRLGIVHSPANLSQLFLADNVTPNVDGFDPLNEGNVTPTDPTSPATGYAELDDEKPGPTP